MYLWTEEKRAAVKFGIVAAVIALPIAAAVTYMDNLGSAFNKMTAAALDTPEKHLPARCNILAEGWCNNDKPIIVAKPVAQTPKFTAQAPIDVKPKRFQFTVNASAAPR